MALIPQPPQSPTSSSSTSRPVTSFTPAPPSSGTSDFARVTITKITQTTFSAPGLTISSVTIIATIEGSLLGGLRTKIGQTSTPAKGREPIQSQPQQLSGFTDQKKTASAPTPSTDASKTSSLNQNIPLPVANPKPILSSQQPTSNISFVNLPQQNSTTSQTSAKTDRAGTPIQNSLSEPKLAKTNKQSSEQPNLQTNERAQTEESSTQDGVSASTNSKLEIRGHNIMFKSANIQSQSQILSDEIKSFMVRDVFITCSILKKNPDNGLLFETPQKTSEELQSLQHIDEELTTISQSGETPKNIEKLNTISTLIQTKENQAIKIPGKSQDFQSSSFESKISQLRGRIEQLSSEGKKILEKFKQDLEQKTSSTLKEKSQQAAVKTQDSDAQILLKSKNLNSQLLQTTKTAPPPVPTQSSKEIITQTKENKQIPLAEQNQINNRSAKEPKKIFKTRKEAKDFVRKSKKSKKRVQTLVELAYPLKPKKLLGKLQDDEENKSSLEDDDSENSKSSKRYNHNVSLILERKTILGDVFNEHIENELTATIQTVASFCIGTVPITYEQFANFLNEAWKNEEIFLTEEGEVLDLDGDLICLTHVKNEKSFLHVVIHNKDITFSVLDDKDKYPMVFVSYFGAKNYAQRFGFSLPTELQRETAAGLELPKINQEMRKFKYGCASDEIEITDANFCYFQDSDYTPNLTEVGFFNGKNSIQVGDTEYLTKDSKSPYGCYDMSGNVYDWTETVNQEMLVLKGGSFLDPKENLRISHRRFAKPTDCFPDVGFRIALNDID